MSLYASFRSDNNNIDEIEKKFDKLEGKNKGYNELDETYWNPKHVGGDNLKGEATIRFLPAPLSSDGKTQEPFPIVKYHTYTLTRDGKYYIQRGRDSLGRGEKDPAVEYNATIWQDKSLTKEEKVSRIAKKKEYYIANIYVVKDPLMPENEGKVFRWQFGRQIFKKISNALKPEFETQQPVVVYDPIEGADFHFRVTPRRIVDASGKAIMIPNYESSAFDNPSKRWDINSGEFDNIWKQEYSLQSEIAEDKFLSYEELKRELDRVFNRDTVLVDEPTKQQRQPPVSANNDQNTFSEEINDDLPDMFDSGNSDSGIDNTGDLDFTSTQSNNSDNSDDDAWFKELDLDK